MALLVQKLVSEVPELIEKGVSLRHLGRRDRFAPEVLDALDKAVEFHFTVERDSRYGLALDYSGRSELLHAIECLVQDGVESPKNM